jgi:hypothetical protein
MFDLATAGPRLDNVRLEHSATVSNRCLKSRWPVDLSRRSNPRAYRHFEPMFEIRDGWSTFRTGVRNSERLVDMSNRRSKFGTAGRHVEPAFEIRDDRSTCRTGVRNPGRLVDMSNRRSKSRTVGRHFEPAFEIRDDQSTFEPAFDPSLVRAPAPSSNARATCARPARTPVTIPSERCATPMTTPSSSCTAAAIPARSTTSALPSAHATAARTTSARNTAPSGNTHECRRPLHQRRRWRNRMRAPAERHLRVTHQLLIRSPRPRPATAATMSAITTDPRPRIVTSCRFWSSGNP